MFVQVNQFSKVNNVERIFLVTPASITNFVLKDLLSGIVGREDIHVCSIVKFNTCHFLFKHDVNKNGDLLKILTFPGRYLRLASAN